MRRGAATRLTTLFLILLLVSGSVGSVRAQTPAIDLANALRDAASRDAYPAWGNQFHGRRHRPPCSPKRRLLAGAAIGAIAAMLTVRQAARENGGTVGAKGTLAGAGYGAALGAFIGLKTCR
jgi:hypothetical protein